jgi:hypothetical protein
MSIICPEIRMCEVKYIGNFMWPLFLLPVKDAILNNLLKLQIIPYVNNLM